MRKLFTGVMGISLLLLGVGNVSAESVDSVVGNLQNDQVYSKLVQHGVSDKKAKKISEFEQVISKLNKEGKQLRVENAPDLSDEYVRNNMDEYRDRVIALDPAAVKKELNTLINIQVNGNNDLNAIIDRDKESNNLKDSYTVVYPDGSSVSLNFKSGIRTDKSDDTVETNTTHLYGPWTRDTGVGYHTGTAGTSSSPKVGSYYSDCSWSYASGVNEGWIDQIFYWKVLKGSDGKYYIQDDGTNEGSEYMSGIVKKDSAVYNNKKPGKFQFVASSSGYMQGYTDVVFKTEQAFSASFGALSINLNGQTSWHQYAICEVSNAGIEWGYAGDNL